MSAQSHRLFVGNLPHEATQDEILSKFKKYGNVESVEIRTKKDPSTGDPLATFSFVNVTGDRESINQCAQLLNGIKIGGRNIKVEVAKESFLQRLQRERQAGNKTAPPPVVNPPQPSVLPKAKDNVSKKPVPEKKVVLKKPVSSSSESSDSEDEDVKFHQTSKLPMFKGIKSHIEPKPQLEKEKKSTFSNLSISNSSLNKRSTNPHLRSDNSDFLKKFELFSDVWKDDDEPSYQNNSFGSKFRKEEKNDAFSNRNSFNKKADNWQSRNQLNQKNGSGNAGPVSAAEVKRLKSIDEKRQAFEQQKKAVKLALSDTSAPQMNKKVVFGDDDDDDEQPQGKQHSKRKPEFAKDQKHNSLALFNDSDDEANADDWKNQFEVKRQFQGEKGKKLLQLQSNFNNDRRFNIDERFYEGEDETNPKSSIKPPGTSDLSEEGVEGIEGLAQEREQQLQILSSILGQSIPTTQPAVHQESKAKGMLRFDPSKPNHVKYELSKEPKEKKRKKKSSSKNEGEDEEEDDEEESNKQKFRREEKEPEPVSQNKFYTVSDALANSLRQSKEGQSSAFSLLSMFGSPSVPSESHVKESVARIEPMRQDLKKRPVLDDSSSDEEGPTAAYNAAAQSKAFPASNPGVRSSHGVWQESFFLQSGDSRLKEGNDFLNVNIDNPTDIAPKRYAILKGLKKKQIKHDGVWRKNDMPKPNSWKGASKNKVHSFKPKRKERKLVR